MRGRRTAPDFERDESTAGSPDVDRSSCERKLRPLTFVMGLVPALIVASAILSLVRGAG
jgi:hypothetical protein